MGYGNSCGGYYCYVDRQVVMITVATFRTRFPEFSDDIEFPEERIQLFIDDSVILYMGDDENHWRGKYDIAQSYVTAHLFSVATGSEAGDASSKGGPISSKSAGGVSLSRSISVKDRSDGDDFLMATTYGQQFLSIRNKCFVGVLVANQL